ncbi:MAG: hypothetical protein M0021_09930 [Clostridia bacterium]|nr:hypothetical protein [Clostridia bacterium]
MAEFIANNLFLMLWAVAFCSFALGAAIMAVMAMSGRQSDCERCIALREYIKVREVL